jgi:hypothetical protein
MTTIEINLLQEKAKTRKDGVYSYKRNLYVVRDNNFIAFGNYFGECFQRFGNFNISIGKVNKYDLRKKLTQWLKEQK